MWPIATRGTEQAYRSGGGAGGRQLSNAWAEAVNDRVDPPTPRQQFQMTKLEAIRLGLTVVSGICWTIVYIEGIRVGFRDRSYAIPFLALALNIAWELLHTVFGFRAGVSTQTIINGVWFAFDVGILYTY